MTFFSQKDPKWKNDILGSCRDTLGQSSCFLTSLCNLNLYLKFTKKLNPPEMNDLFTRNNLWTAGCLINAPKIAAYFDLEYIRTTRVPEMLCLAETDHYKKLGVPQHFFLYDPEKKKRIDPLDLEPAWEPNIYNIVSYRIFRLKPKPEIPSDIPSPEPQNAPTSPQPIHPPTYQADKWGQLRQAAGDFISWLHNLIFK